MKRPTILDVAARAGVSKSLVSLVLRGSSSVSEDKRERVTKAMAELGYRPNAVARSLVRRRTNLLGVLLADLHNPFFAEVVDGVQRAGASHGFRTIISTGDRWARSEADALDTLLEMRTDGLILASPVLGMDVIAEASKELPTVLIARTSKHPTLDSVSNDDAKGTALAVEHLATLGHRRIAHIDGGNAAGSEERKSSYSNVMKRLNLEAEARIVGGAHSEEGGRKGVAALLATGERPTAIFAGNDLCALGALAALDEQGIRVPEDVSIVGYDNIALAGLRQIHLTTVNQPRPDMGTIAVTLLLERLEQDRAQSRSILLPPTLVVRGTTAPPPAQGARRRPS